MIKSVLVREIVNSDVGENLELANLGGGFRDCSTDNVITCTRIEANIEKSLSKCQTEQDFRVKYNYSLFQPLTISTILLWPLCHIPDCYSILMLKNVAATLPQDSGEKQSAEELESIIECIAIFYQMGKTKLDYDEKRGITTSNSIGQTYIFVLT